MHIAATISPVIVMILLGYLLRRKGFFSEQTVRELSSLVYWVGLPCLLFYKISTTTVDFSVCGRIYAVLLIALLASVLAGYIGAKVFKVPKASVSAVVQGGFRSNLAYIGLPVLMYSFPDASSQAAQSIQTLAVFLLALMVMTNNTVAVIIFSIHQHAFNRKAIGKIVFNILTNPLLISSAAGLAAGRFIETLPAMPERTLSAFSQMVLPLALISVGATIANRKMMDHFFPAVLASVIKLGFCPVVGYLIVRYGIVLANEQMRLAMIFMACPTAAASYILADQLGGDRKLAATIIVISTVLSIISLTLVVALF